ncbi:MAG: ribosome biogenesis GTPase Der [Desulfobacterales bacterium]|nr:ribosome biogenesis GTPase Der [Desulfobacterales bacterium]
MKPLVALVGRPNVGKSTLFNRIIGKKQALTDDLPGVTRDRHFGEATHHNSTFILVDTGGFLFTSEDHFISDIQEQVLKAIEDSDVIILVLDGKHGLSPFDVDLVHLLRKQAKPVLFVVNKIDSYELENRVSEFYHLGIDELIPISGEHGYGTSDFLDRLIKHFPETPPTDTTISNDMIKVAVVGRPNVGKSTLINCILKEKRVITNEVPGTTRDSIDTFYSIDNQNYLLIDTAGIRRKASVTQKIEKISVIKSLKSLERCDVALLLIDATTGITDQDITISGYANDRGCACIFLINKWDIIEKEKTTTKTFIQNLKDRSKYLHFAPVITVSAVTGFHVNHVFKVIHEVYQQYTTRVGTGTINRILENTIRHKEPPLFLGKRIKIYYITQVSIMPPTFVCFVNFPEAVHFSYKRYLINRIREYTQLDKIPIRLLFRQKTKKNFIAG